MAKRQTIKTFVIPQKKDELLKKALKEFYRLRKLGFACKIAEFSTVCSGGILHGVDIEATQRFADYDQTPGLNGPGAAESTVSPPEPAQHKE